MDRKRTAWKKSRKFGDVYGGRSHPKIPDRIVARAHSLPPLGSEEDKPLFIQDNPSRDFFHPLSQEEILSALENLPKDDWSSITHIWLRRAKKSEYEKGELPFALFICGSGVRLIVLYAWPENMQLYISEKPPSERQLKPYANYCQNLKTNKDGWFLKWELEQLKKFVIEVVLFHEVGHNVDWFQRHWSKANKGSIEEFADQYAFEYTSKRTKKYGVGV